MTYFSELPALDDQATRDLMMILDRWDTSDPSKRDEIRAEIEGTIAELIVDVAVCVRGER